MSVRRGLFRSWVVGSALWMGWVAIRFDLLNDPNKLYVLDAVVFMAPPLLAFAIFLALDWIIRGFLRPK